MYKKLYNNLYVGYSGLNMDSSWQILGLSTHSEAVLREVKAGRGTPVLISKHTNLSRPAIYAILHKLEKQGLVKEQFEKKTRQWEIAHTSQINTLLESAKVSLLELKEEKQLSHRDPEVEVNLYRGKETISNLMKEIFTVHRGQKCIGIQGANVYSGWKDLLGVDFVNTLNKVIKKNKMINQPIVPTGHFEEAVDIFGLEWATHFEGRTARTNEIDRKYFNHKGELFFFKDSAYLVSMSENLVVEIKNSHIHKVLMSLVEYIQDTSRLIDGNERLRQIIAAQSQR